MKLNIRGSKITITDSMRSHIENKMSKLDKYFEKPDEIETGVLIRIRNVEQIVEVTIQTTKHTIRAEESHSDLYAAIDLVIDKLERQIRKNKTKLANRYQKEPVMEFNFSFDEEPIDEEHNKIVKRKTIDSKPMSEEEAILQMNLLNHDFFIFKNIDEDCYSAIYLRKDGDYGIIDAK